MPKGRLLAEGRAVRTRLAKARSQERRTARELGAKLTPASGSRWHAKGDSQTKRWYVENKTTDATQFILRAQELMQGQFAALREGKRFVMQVDISGARYAVLPWDDAKELMS